MFYYNVDLTETILGRGTAPSLVLRLIQRLPDDSLTTALASGGRDHFGWGMDRHIQADIFDAISTGTRATIGAAGMKPPEIPNYPRPEALKEEVAAATGKSVSLQDIFKKFTSNT